MPPSPHPRRTRRRNISTALATGDRPPPSRNHSRRNPFPRPPPGSLTGPPAPAARTLRTFYPSAIPACPPGPARPPCTGLPTGV